MQDYFNFFTAKTRPGMHCEFPECRYDQFHYHCKFCPVAFKGLMTDRMTKHLRSTHPKVAANIDSVTAKPDTQNSHSDNTSAGTSTIVEARSSDTSNPASDILSPVFFTPPKGVVVKKSKVSTPLAAEPGNVLFSSPGVSPLFHKAAASTESSSLPDNVQAELYENIQEPTIVGKETGMTPEHKCIVEGCVSTFKLTLSQLHRPKPAAKISR